MTHDELVGRKIGTYQVLRRLGTGGMGVVYLAEHPDIGKRVAIKVLHEEASKNPSIVDRFFAEARAVNLIGHPNIVDIIDLSRLSDGRSYLVMEYLEGATLAQFLRAQGALRAEDALPVVIPVCDALAAAHELGIVHRDLKPDNIFLVQRPQQEHLVKILDFGIAKLSVELGGAEKTQAGMLIGTPHYMSPEQALGRNSDVSPGSDVFSVGVILYRMLAGRLPFDSPAIGEVLVAITTQEPPALDTLRGDLPRDLIQVVQRAMAKRKDDRYASAGALGAALRTVADAHRKATPHTPLPLPVPDSRRARTPAGGLPRAGVADAARVSAGAGGEPSGRTVALGDEDLLSEETTPSSPSARALGLRAGSDAPEVLSDLKTPLGVRQAVAGAAALPPLGAGPEGTPLAISRPVTASQARSRRWAIVVVGGGLGGLAIGAFLFAPFRRVPARASVEPAAAIAGESATGTGPVVPPSVPPQQPAAGPVVATCTLALSSTPPGATIVLKINGVPQIPTTAPTDVLVTKGAHVDVTFALPGYEVAMRSLEATGDQAVAMTLTPVAPAAQTSAPGQAAAPATPAVQTKPAHHATEDTGARPTPDKTTTRKSGPKTSAKQGGSDDLEDGNF